MRIEKSGLSEVIFLWPHRHGNARSRFSETWDCKRFAEFGIDQNIVRGKQSLSAVAGTSRGLHHQAPPHPQDKPVRCRRGRLLDVAKVANSPRYAFEQADICDRAALDGIFAAHAVMHLAAESRIDRSNDGLAHTRRVGLQPLGNVASGAGAHG